MGERDTLCIGSQMIIASPTELVKYHKRISLESLSLLRHAISSFSPYKTHPPQRQIWERFV